jgi:hypothetical protein
MVNKMRVAAKQHPISAIPVPQSIHNSVLPFPQLVAKFLLNEQGAMAL